jgi:hypothetical protein
MHTANIVMGNQCANYMIRTIFSQNRLTSASLDEYLVLGNQIFGSDARESQNINHWKTRYIYSRKYNFN